VDKAICTYRGDNGTIVG